MAAPPGAPILAGRPHRNRCELDLLVYDFDALPVRRAILPAGSLFLPWEPQPHWRGQKVPITLGTGATAFDWGTSAPDGHFLRWEDFFAHCEPL